VPSCHIPPFDALTHFWVKDHHLDLGVHIFMVALYEQLFFFFNSGFYNGHERPQYHGD
jgi:hypothetical protein